MAKKYQCRPSTLFDIADPYTAYCFDEACAYIYKKLEDGEEPIFEKEYKSFTELYASYAI